MVKLGRSLLDSSYEDGEEKDYLATTCFLKKHKGATWRQVVEQDPDYILWILQESDVKLGERLRDQLMWAMEDR